MGFVDPIEISTVLIEANSSVYVVRVDAVQAFLWEAAQERLREERGD